MRVFSAIRILERTSSNVVPPPPLAAEKEEAKAVLTSFLKKQGFSNAVSIRTINKSDLFIDHLASRLHSVHKFGHPVGRELPTIEIRDALIPYLESLLKERGNILVDFLENFPEPLVKGKLVAPVSLLNLSLNSKKLKAVSRVSETGPAGQLPPQTLYLMELGLDLEQIKIMACRCPNFAYFSLEGKIKPLVEFFLDHGVLKSDLPTILTKLPQLCGLSISENIIPTMRFFENLGVDKTQWAKVLHRCPRILIHSRQKVERTLAFFYEIGISTVSIGKILTRFPTIMDLSVEDKIRPASEYLLSLGIDAASVLQQSPETFGLSIKANLKPVTEFFLERGYSIEEVGTMVSKFKTFFTLSLANLTPKWEFFLTMDYSKEELVKFPQYFGYRLEGRIKPRYALVKESGVKIGLSQMLAPSNHDLDKALKRRMEKMLAG